MLILNDFAGYPLLPDHLDRLLSQPWSKFASLMLDKWIAYTELEFDVKGGGSNG